MKVENKVQFTYISEILVEHLDEQVDGFQAPELIVVYVHAQRKKQPGVPPASPTAASILSHSVHQQSSNVHNSQRPWKFPLVNTGNYGLGDNAPRPISERPHVFAFC